MDYRLPNNSHPVCSVNGKITQLVLFYQCPVSEEPSLAGHYFEGIISALGPDVHVFIEVQLPNGTTITRLPKPQPNVDLIVLNPERNEMLFGLTSWVQDVLLSFETAAGTSFLYYNSARLDECVLSELAKQHPGLQFAPLNRPGWAGGNLLPVRDAEHNFLLVGADLLYDEVGSLRGASADLALQGLTQQLKQTFVCDSVIWLGRDGVSGMLRERQPLFHIDLYVCPLGRLEIAPDCQSIAVAELRPETCYLPWSDEQAELAAALDQTANWLAAGAENSGIKFRVLRMPLLVFADEPGHIGSYTNAITETINGRCRLLLPDYCPAALSDELPHPLALGIIALQQQLLFQLQEEGIHEVIFVKHDFYSLSRREGALHCYTKIVARNPPK